MIFILFVLSVGVLTDADHRCPEHTDMGDLIMSRYVAPKLSLQRKLQSKRGKKDPAPTVIAADATDVVAESAVAEPSLSPVPASVPAVSPVPVDDSSQMSGVRGEILCQIKSLFDSF